MRFLSCGHTFYFVLASGSLKPLSAVLSGRGLITLMTFYNTSWALYLVEDSVRSYLSSQTKQCAKSPFNFAHITLLYRKGLEQWTDLHTFLKGTVTRCTLYVAQRGWQMIRFNQYQGAHSHFWWSMYRWPSLDLEKAIVSIVLQAYLLNERKPKAFTARCLWSHFAIAVMEHVLCLPQTSVHKYIVHSHT